MTPLIKYKTDLLQYAEWMDLYVDDSPYYAMRDYRDAVSRATDLGIYDPTHQLLEKLIEKINTI